MAYLLLVLYIALLYLSWRLSKTHNAAASVIIGSLAIHGLMFYSVYVFRDFTWAECPPMCGLQNWSSTLRLHSVLSIILAVIDRLELSRSGKWR